MEAVPLAHPCGAAAGAWMEVQTEAPPARWARLGVMGTWAVRDQQSPQEEQGGRARPPRTALAAQAREGRLRRQSAWPAAAPVAAPRRARRRRRLRARQRRRACNDACGLSMRVAATERDCSHTICLHTFFWNNTCYGSGQSLCHVWSIGRYPLGVPPYAHLQLPTQHD